jgi:HK97 family phage major capsid protein
MTPEELKSIIDSLDEKLKEAVSKADIELLRKEMSDKLKEMQEDETLKGQIEALKAEINQKLIAQWDAVKALQIPAEPMTVKDQLKKAIKDAIIASGHTEEYEHEGQKLIRLKDSRNRNLNVSIDFVSKVAVDMNTANAVRPGSSPGVNIGFLTAYGMNPTILPNSMNQHFVGAGFPVTPITDKYFGVLCEVTETDGAAVKAETAAAGQSSFLWKTIEYKVFDYSAAFRVHQNTLDDLDNVVERIATLGMDRLLSQIDTSALGAAGDNSATPLGLKTANYHTDYDTALRAGLVVEPNIVDVVKNMILQANNADHDVDCIILNRNDVAEIESLKDQNANTVMLAGVRLGQSGKLEYMYGLKVIINNKMTARTTIVGKLTDMLQFGDRQLTALRMGYDQTTDFSKNIVTLQLDARAAIGIGNPTAIIYCSDIDAAIVALTAS